MGPVNCAVVECTNNSRMLEKWKNSECETHHGVLKKECGCEQPFKLYCFPGPVRYLEKRQKWIKLIKRVNPDKSQWQPKSSDRICSIHFVDNVPSVENPNPTLNMGYEMRQSTSRRTLFKNPLPSAKKKSKKIDDRETLGVTEANPFLSPPRSPDQQLTVDIFTPPTQDHQYCLSEGTKQCLVCKDKKSLILSLTRKIGTLSRENKRLKKEALLQKNQNTPFSSQKIKTDTKMNFYTGIMTIAAFNAIFALLKPYISCMVYWKGCSKARKATHSKIKRRNNNSNTTTRKLSAKNEFLLTLMRLRLGLLNEDLADRFCISTTLCSNIFTSWVKFLRKTLADVLVNWIPKESILEHMPDIYKEKGYGNVRCIIDCSEIFIERSKSLNVQAVTWSDYKHHNTVKFLIGISPTGYITFLSDCYGGRASDKFICNDSGFFELLEYGDNIMADRGFQITEELLLRYCHLVVPPGARLKSQMTFMECSKTKSVANLRIHVERSIRRIKTYRILQTPLPITMLHHVDDIVRTCAAFCNLKSMLIQKAKKKDS